MELYLTEKETKLLLRELHNNINIGYSVEVLSLFCSILSQSSLRLEEVFK